MKITGAALSAIFMGMSTVFNKTFADVQTTYQKIAMTVPSSSGPLDVFVIDSGINASGVGTLNSLNTQ